MVHRRWRSGSRNWCCDLGRKLLYVPSPRSLKPEAVAPFLHECAHARKHYHTRKPEHVIEWEAEMWVHKTMRRLGITVTRSISANSVLNVMYHVALARKAGQKIDPRVARYCWARRRIAETWSTGMCAPKHRTLRWHPQRTIEVFHSRQKGRL